MNILLIITTLIVDKEYELQFILSQDMFALVRRALAYNIFLKKEIINILKNDNDFFVKDNLKDNLKINYEEASKHS